MTDTTNVQMLRTRLINADTRLRSARNALERADADPAEFEAATRKLIGE